MRALSTINRYRYWCNRPAGKTKRFAVRDKSVADIVAAKQKAGGGYLSSDEASRVLRAYGFPAVPVRDRAARAATSPPPRNAIGYPVVLKAQGEKIVHKSDFGGVIVGIADRDELQQAFRTMKTNLSKAGVSRDVEGYLVQEMAHGGKEVVLGMSTDETFGPLLMFGMGGKYVEIIKDIVFRVMPVTDVDAWEMVKGIRSYPLLEGRARGEKGGHRVHRRVDPEARARW